MWRPVRNPSHRGSYPLLPEPQRVQDARVGAAPRGVAALRQMRGAEDSQMKWHGEKSLTAFCVIFGLGSLIYAMFVVWIACWPLALAIITLTAIIIGAGFLP